MRILAIALWALFAATGCYESLSPTDAGPPPPPPPPPPAEELDLLFVMENSGNLSEEQWSLAAELPRLLGALASGDVDGDGEPDVRPFRSIHAGVVTTDMGVGGFTIPRCARSDFGDDGVLRTQGRADLAGCAASYPSILAWDPVTAPPTEEAAAALACVIVGVGTGGCGFEQQLEAPLKALSPSAPTAWTADAYAAPIFHAGSAGHGDGANAGFLRAGSLLAIVILTIEEDCSWRDPELMNVVSEVYSSADLNLRCFAYPEALHPIERYVDGLLQLRRDPSQLAFFPIAGIPEDLEPAPGAPIAWDALVADDLALRDDRMEERVDPTAPQRLIPSCAVPGRGSALPPVRLARVARELEARGARVGIGSVCRESYRDPITSLVLALRR